MKTLLLTCIVLLWSSAYAYAQADPEGTLYVYVDEDGEELVSAHPRQDLTYVERITPDHTIKVGKAPARDKLAKRLEPYLELVERIAPKYELDPVFVLAIIWAESGFDPEATSPVGAMGLMQLMPSNAQHFELDDPYDPAQNITGGCMLLAELTARYDGDVSLILAAYSAGDKHVQRAGGVPSFSKSYIARVARAHARLIHHFQGETP